MYTIGFILWMLVLVFYEIIMDNICALCNSDESLQFVPFTENTFKDSVFLCYDCLEKMDMKRDPSDVKIEVMHRKKRKFEEIGFKSIEFLNKIDPDTLPEYGYDPRIPFKKIKFTKSNKEHIIDFKCQYTHHDWDKLFPFTPSDRYFKAMIQKHEIELENFRNWQTIEHKKDTLANAEMLHCESEIKDVHFHFQ